MLRDILAIAAGFGLWSVLWLGGNQLVTRLFPGALGSDGSTSHTGLLVTLIGLSLVASAAAGYVTNAISLNPGNLPQIILGVVLLLVGIMVQRQSWALLPLWYHLVFLVMLIPAVLFGATLRK
jgi:hypothetical protein